MRTPGSTFPAVAALLCLIAALAPAVAAADPREIRVGFRPDTPPFSATDPNATAGYSGFIADMCVAIVDRIGAEIVPVEVDVANRFAALAREPGPDWPEPPIDLLCDPTTLTLDRAATWHFTPIVFVAGVSFLYSDKADKAAFTAANAARAARSDIRRLTAPDGRLPTCAEADADPRTVVSNRIAYLRGTTAARVVGRPDLLDVYRPRGDETVCVEEVASHTEGLDRMCRGDVAFYFGDRDILVARLRLQMAKTPDCDARASLRFVSYEPYALIVGDPALLVPVQRAVYELFSDNVPRDLFARHFGGKTPTPLLDALFTANAIEPR